MRQHSGLRRKQKGKRIATNRSTQPWSHASDYQGLVREDCPSVWLCLSTFYFGSRRAFAKTGKMHKSSGNCTHTSLCKQIVSLFSYFQLISTIWLPQLPQSPPSAHCAVSPLLTFFYWSILVNIEDIAHCTLSWPSPQTKVRQCTESAKRYCISALYVLVQCTYTENIPDCGIAMRLNLQLL